MPEYQSLYRKYRSQTFADLVGQDAASRALQGAIIGGRVSHAYLFSGSRGTGKTSALGDIRSALRDAGITVIARPPRDGDPAGAAVVIDDAHLLGASDLDELTDLVSDPATTVVIAAEPLAHHPALAALSTALARQNPVVTLDALAPTEVNRSIAEILGAPPPVELVRAVMSTTAGLPFLVRPAVTALGSPDGDSQAEAVAQAAQDRRVLGRERIPVRAVQVREDLAVAVEHRDLVLPDDDVVVHPDVPRDLPHDVLSLELVIPGDRHGTGQAFRPSRRLVRPPSAAEEESDWDHRLT